MNKEDRKLKVGHTLLPSDVRFLEAEAALRHSNRSEALRYIINLYRKQKMRKISQLAGLL